MYYRVIPFSQSFDTYWLIYAAQDNSIYKPGSIVEIPYWKSKQLAVCFWEVTLAEINCNINDICIWK